MAKLDRRQGRVPTLVEDVSSSSSSDEENIREALGYSKESTPEAEVASTPSLKHTPITYGIQGRGKGKDVSMEASETTKDASPADQSPRVPFVAKGVLARARQLLLGMNNSFFGSGSSFSVSGETVEAAKKTLLEFMQQDISSALPHQTAISLAIATLLSSGVSSIHSFDLTQASDLNRIFTSYKMAQDDLVESKDYFSTADQMKTELSSALGTADQVMRMDAEAQQALTTADAAVEELKRLMKAALENQCKCKKRAEESVSTLHDTSYQVDELAKKFENHESRKLVMQTRKTEAEVRLQMVEAEWNAIKASLQLSPLVGQGPPPQATEPIPQAIAPVGPVESVDEEIKRFCQETNTGAIPADEGEETLAISLLDKEFSLPSFDTAGGIKKDGI